MRTIVYYSATLILIFFASCNEWYNHSLGNNLSLWDGDRIEDRIIVYCEGNCHGGVYVVPTYARHYDNTGHYAEYVEIAKSNKEWVIVKTQRIKEKQNYYWIVSKAFSLANLDCSKIDCDSIIQKHVTGPLTLDEFQNKKQLLKIDLDF